VVERRQPAAGPQHLGRLGRARDRIHPVPGRPRDDRVEFPAGCVPGFERRHLDLDSTAPREAGHPGVGLDSEHLAASHLELAGGDASTTADVDDVRPRAGGDDPLHQGVGVKGPGPVVAVGVHAERLRHLPVLMKLGSGKTRPLRRYSDHAPTINGHVPTLSTGPGEGRRDARCRPG